MSRRRARHRAVRAVPLRRTAATVGMAAAVGGVAVGGYAAVQGPGAIGETASALAGLAGLSGPVPGSVEPSGDAAALAADREDDRSGASRAEARAPLVVPVPGLPTSSSAELAARQLEQDQLAVIGRERTARIAAERAEEQRLAEEQRREEERRAEEERLAEEQRLAEEAAAAEAAAAEPAPEGPPAEPPAPADPGSNRSVAQGLLPTYGWDDADQWSCLDSLWERESRWDHTARNPSSGAFGIPQALPASKMATAGADWETNPETQIRWGLGYIDERYGTPCSAWAHSEEHNWY